MTEAPEPGRALDLLVAEKALGWFWVRYAGRPEECCHGELEAFLCPPGEWEKLDHGKDGDRGRYMKDDGKYPRERNPSYGRLPRFSTEREAALTILDHYVEAGFGTMLEMGRDMGFHAYVGPHAAEGESPAHAVCLAALLAAEALTKGSA